MRNICPLLLPIVILALLPLAACQQAAQSVVVYTSVDQVYSEPLFAKFTEKTGIQVSPVYDIEASKTVGLANRLIAEKEKPQADVFWSGEILQTINLKQEGVLEAADIEAASALPASFVDADRQWFAFGGRARVLIYNETLISAAELPLTTEAFAEGTRVADSAIAYPVFGTTATQVAALYADWGPERARDYFTGLRDAGVSVLEGNSLVKDFVSQEKLAMGLTDTDDAFAEMKTNPDLAILLLDQAEGELGAMVIPNTAARIKNCPHPDTADAFLEYLLSAEAEQELVNIGWIHIPVNQAVTPSPEFESGGIRVAQVDWDLAYEYLEQSKNDMTDIFAR